MFSEKLSENIRIQLPILICLQLVVIIEPLELVVSCFVYVLIDILQIVYTRAFQKVDCMEPTSTLNANWLLRKLLKFEMNLLLLIFWLLSLLEKMYK